MVQRTQLKHFDLHVFAYYVAIFLDDSANFELFKMFCILTRFLVKIGHTTPITRTTDALIIKFLIICS